jgi:hypothetical protein
MLQHQEGAMVESAATCTQKKLQPGVHLATSADDSEDINHFSKV